ncbi:MAG: hypothetical protein EU516_01480 [Promethearchaeota archaeon]|nr:MAG: hypothetical protein EU516_01480 [Candidatus Lokiarchaeota archaeon]
MPSISSASQIKKRTLSFLQKIPKENFLQKSQELIIPLIDHLKHEYAIIPERERIGKGAIYICKHIAKELVSFLINTLQFESNNCLDLCREFYRYDMKNDFLLLKYLSLLILAEFLSKSPQYLHRAIDLIELGATDEEWSVRETSIYPIISCLKKNPDTTLEYLNNLTNRSNENLRRLSSESLRPSGAIKWLRNANKNDKVLHLLSKLRADNSIYVRKSVGNNLKDLSKYMPEKILNLMGNWIKSSKIKVKDDLASEKRLNKEQRNVIWTIKHAMRWIRKRDPKCNKELKEILGINYILYFDEKSNKYAKPN